MGTASGRGLKKPIVVEGFTGDHILIRVDDDANPEFWLTVAYTPEELEALALQHRQWQELHRDATAKQIDIDPGKCCVCGGELKPSTRGMWSPVFKCETCKAVHMVWSPPPPM